MSTVRRFRAIGGFKDDVLYIEHVDGKSYGIIKEDFSNAYPLSTCERLVNKGQWEEIPTDAQLNREGTMKEELKRRDQAIGHLFRRLNEVASQTFWNTVYEEVQGLLNPAPIMEPVEEIVGWVNVYQNETSGEVYTAEAVHLTQEDANKNACCGRISCQPIKVTVQREKKVPVERSVTVNAMIGDGGAYTKGAGITLCDDGRKQMIEFAHYPETYGKKGTLTFTWTEDPTT